MSSNTAPELVKAVEDLSNKFDFLMDEVAPINVRLAALNITLASVLSRLWFRC
jgi:hypothetical protein